MGELPKTKTRGTSMRSLIFSAITACLATAPIHGAQAAGSLGQGGYLSVKEQRKAIVDCKYDIGLRGGTKLRATYVESPYGGPTHLRLLPSATVSEQQAELINACADQRLGRGTVEVVRVRKVDTTCPRGAAVMVGGSGYCPSGW